MGCVQIPMIWALQITLQNTSIQHFVIVFGFYGKVREAVHTALIRTIEYFPIDEPPIAGPRLMAYPKDKSQWRFP